MHMYVCIYIYTYICIYTCLLAQPGNSFTSGFLCPVFSLKEPKAGLLKWGVVGLTWVSRILARLYIGVFIVVQAHRVGPNQVSRVAGGHPSAFHVESAQISLCAVWASDE